MKTEEFVGIKDATRLWQKDVRTLIKWAKSGELRGQYISTGNKRGQWYFETPQARFNRLQVNNNQIQ